MAGRSLPTALQTSLFGTWTRQQIMQVTESRPPPWNRYFSARRRRHLREYATGYLMISPALLLIFLFGIFPVLFALYVSLHKWRIVRGDFIGLDHYLAAIANLTYILLLFLGVGALIGAYILLRNLRRDLQAEPKGAWLQAIPGLLFAAATVSFFRWAFFFMPEFLDIATKMRGQERTRELFIRLLGEAFAAESIIPLWRTFVFILIAAILVGIVAAIIQPSSRNPGYQARFAILWLSLVIGLGLLYVLFQGVQSAYASAVETGEDPGIWPQMVAVVSGVILLGAAWLLWRSAEGQTSNRSFILRLLGSIALMVGGVLLIVEIPTIVASGDEGLWNGLKVTVFFSLGTVPIQLTIALFLAVLLFQKLRGSEAFRIMYFLPYVTPVIATATVFRFLFSDRKSAPINTILSWIGVKPQLWLREPDGIFAILAAGLGIENFPEVLLPQWLPLHLHATLADWMTGPSMALMVIITLSIWMFVGYNVVIYLAGLGNIPAELTEAAQIDGANRWAVFRHITFPLLSPTTYFLSLLAVMGTFKAFNTIWVMRIGQALGTTDTLSVVIFEEFFQKSRYGYASALAFVLFGIILCLTFVNSRLQGSRVFYG
ncbi:MAG: sugar ABC transporter permease [Caldilineales bacterium]|nr:sugar ABC transporter permease [Caldilineales bacterium]